MALTKAQKIGYLVRAFTRQKISRLEGETDAQFVQRIVNQRIQEFKTKLLTSIIRNQEQVETQGDLDVSDL